MRVRVKGFVGLTIAAQAAWSALKMPASGCVEKCQSHLAHEDFYPHPFK